MLPRQVSSAATLEYFTRNLSDAQRAALELQPGDIFAREPDRELLAQFPEALMLPAGPEGRAGEPDAALAHLRVPIEYRFAPGDECDGATLDLPLLALPNLTRAAVDAALPGLAAPRIEALLRSLPKDARRSLIPIGACRSWSSCDPPAVPAPTWGGCPSGCRSPADCPRPSFISTSARYRRI